MTEVFYQALCPTVMLLTKALKSPARAPLRSRIVTSNFASLALLQGSC